MAKKQFILIMTDSTRWDMVGCYGNPAVHTPNLDALASGGVRFDRAYSVQPVCGPARSAIFTGLFPHTNGSWANGLALGEDVRTVGQLLRGGGVRTAYIGKWHLDASDYFGTGLCPDGWDDEYWYDMRRYLDELTPEERAASRDRRTCLENGGIPEGFTFGARCTRRAEEYLARYGAEDFFLTVSYDEPHDPCLCPEPYASMFADYDFPKAPNVWDTLEGKPDYQKVWAGESRFRDRDALRIRPRLQLGCNAFADEMIGRVMRAAERFAPDATILYTSDHGGAFQSHCIDGKGPAVYDEVARVPFILRGGRGSGVPAGVSTAQPVTHLSLTPTVLDYFGVPAPLWQEGHSMLEAFTHPERRVNDYIFIEFGRLESMCDRFGGFQPMRAVYDGRYKLAVHLLDSTDEFYDMQEDPYEMRNLITDESLAGVRARLHDALIRNMNDTRDGFRTHQWENRPWRQARPDTPWIYDEPFRKWPYKPGHLDYCTGAPLDDMTYEEQYRILNPGKR